jgi:3-hydroxybutyryl-CoA dehydrogenase
MKTVAVVGAGTMGNGIVQVCAMHGYDTLMVDVVDDFLQRGMKTIESSLLRMEKKGKLSAQEKDAALGRIKATTNFDMVGDAELVVEAVPENMELKKEIFRKLDSLCSEDAILGTNTSSLPVTEIASAISRPERVVGMHFMNPVPVMKGVEVIRGHETADGTVKRVLEFLHSIGKVGGVAPDYPGFITTRILNVYLNEAVNCVLLGAKPEDVDNLMVHCCNMPIGPLKLLDMVGLDVHLKVQDFLASEFGDGYKASLLTRQMVRAGRLGMKSGKGFYNYENKD